MNTPLPAVQFPRMERRHFEVFAEAMQQARTVALSEKLGALRAVRLLQHETDCQAIARVLAMVNPAFDRARFLESCGVR